MKRFLGILFALALVFSLVAIGLASPVLAAAFTVNSTGDGTDWNPGDGVAETAPGNGICTLRAAIQEANALAGPDTINLPSGTYTISIAGANEDAAATGDLDITDDLTITAADQAPTVIDGGGLDRVFHIHSGNTVEIAGVTVQNGSITGDGGAILNQGSLTLTTVAVKDSAATGDGGGLYQVGAAQLVASTISGNSAVRGGGIFNSVGQTMTIINTTISGNAAIGPSGKGGGIYNSFGTVILVHATITLNSVPSPFVGGGVDSGTYTFKNTIIANNQGRDCSGAGSATDCGHNLMGDGTCPGPTAPDPKLGPLADNGGPTLTHALLPGSPAIDAVPVADCTDIDGNPVTTDQRGFSRPQGAACDIGAFEYSPPYPPPAADFSAEPTAGVVPLTVNFTDESIGDITEWSWDFGDSGTSDEQSPSHTYTSVGIYTVSLTVSRLGQTDIETKVDYITVYEQPSPTVGGVIVRVEKLGLMIPWIIVTAMVLLAITSLALWMKKNKME